MRLNTVHSMPLKATDNAGSIIETAYQNHLKVVFVDGSSKNLAYIYTETHFLHVKILEEANLFA